MRKHTTNIFYKTYSTFLISTVLFLLGTANSRAYTVTNLSAYYHLGQVFLTWTNPDVTNLQYNVYRSTSKFTSASQLTSSALLGFVCDSSSKNIRLSQLFFQPIYFRITNGGTPLESNQGLYVVTCTDNQSYYYAVTVTTRSNNSESKIINPGQNSLSASVNEIFKKPLPVFQYSSTWQNGETVNRYVQFGNNQETSLYPAMNSTGSYGFNFYVLKRGSAVNYPLIVLEEGVTEGSIKGNGFGELEDKTITNCYIIGVEDWLPVPGPNGHVGNNTYFCCYHEDFNIYSGTNPVPNNGIIKAFPQHRYIEAIRWAKKHLPVDTTRIYTVGNSAGGYGAELTAAIIPEEIAAVYSIVSPVSVGPVDDVSRAMWGTWATNLNTDILNWQTGSPLQVRTLMDTRRMLDMNEQRDIPLIFDIHGRNDHTVYWTSEKVAWLDSLQANHAGGVFYWDGREHTGIGQDFLDSETTPDFFRYATNKSYPAFSNCSINQNPGNGSKTDGDPIGAINGYLDWDDNITDGNCSYSATVFVKDFYEGGVLFPDQYAGCTTDISFRRLQNFHPAPGSFIKWNNMDAGNVKIQSGSFNYTGGLITLPGIIVNKAGNKITLKIRHCSNRTGEFEEDDDTEESLLYFTPSSNGYSGHIYVEKDENAQVFIYNLLGTLMMQKKILLNAGTNIIEIPFQQTGIYLVQVSSETFSYIHELLF